MFGNRVVGVFVMQNSLKFFAVCFLMFAGCARSPIKKDADAMRISKSEIVISDDLALANLDEALKKNITQLKSANRNAVMRFGPFKIEPDVYAEALLALQKELAAGRFLEAVERDFVMMEVYGTEAWSQVFITSYFEPIIEGSKRPTAKFTRPLYDVPEDMVLIRVRDFAKKLPELFPASDNSLVRDGNLRGRIVATSDGSLPQVYPYWSRGEIDSETMPLKKKAKILAWVDPIDAFVLQIQGSGRVKFSEKEEVRVGYAGQNGQPYVAIGQFLFDRIPKDKMSLQKIEAHLRSLSENERQELLNQNPSYVFFKVIQKQPVTYFGNEVTAGRTIATDPRYFPKGALAFLTYPKPVFPDAAAEEPTGFESRSRFVFDQDTGGAIKGPGRVDLFWGPGPEGKRFSGVIKNNGHLYYLFPKAFISR